MTIPFPFGYFVALAASAANPLEWFRRGVGYFQNTDGTNAVTASGQQVGSWVGSRLGWIAAQNGGANKPDAQAFGTTTANLNFSGSADEYLHYAPGSALFNSGSDVPFSVIVRFRTSATNPFTVTRTLLTFRDGTDGTVADALHLLSYTTTPQWNTSRRGNGGAGDVVSDLNGTPLADTLYTRTHVFNGTTFDEWINGTQTRTGVALDVTTATLNRLYIGTAANNATSLFRGEMYDVVIFDHAINATTRTYWESVVGV